MPRPRSSTFYLPLAPIDAPLELKAKLSVLPPSAANALLAPRASSRPSCPTLLSPPHSSTTSTSCTTTSSSSCTPVKEDECTRLNRVLGIPTSTSPNSLAVPTTNTTTGMSSSTGGTGRRRHTDAPKPSLPLLRPRSPLAATPGSSWAIPPPAKTPPTTTSSDDSTMADSTTTTQQHSESSSQRLPSVILHPTLSVPVPVGTLPVTEDHTETSAMSMAWTSSAAADPVCSGNTVTVSSSSVSSVDVDMSSDDMHAFAFACDEQSPATLPESAPSSSAASTASASTLSSSAAPIPASAPPAPVLPPPTLSGFACGLRTILACRTKVPSRFAPSSRPSSSTGTTASTASRARLPPPPACDSLHPQDTRHLLRREHRMAFPPPPAPLPTPKDASSEGALEEEVYAQQEDEPVERPLTPRQRFRLAPLYLPKVLRRSLGATAWARSETLRAARMAERGPVASYGYAWPAGTPLPTMSTMAYLPGPDGWINGPNGSSSSWWDRLGADPAGCTGNATGSELVWGGYDDDEEELMAGVQSEEQGQGGMSLWDWDDEDAEPVPVQGAAHEDEDAHMSEFVREGAPEPEERPSQHVEVDSPPVSGCPSPAPAALSLPAAVVSATAASPTAYSMVGKFGWDSVWPASPTSPGVATPQASSTGFEQLVVPRMPPVTRRSVRREDGEEEDDEEEEIFRYSPLKPAEEEDEEGEVEMELTDEEEYASHQVSSSCSTPTATSPSFPPAPLRGIAISSSMSDTASEVEEFYDADGDAEMEDHVAVQSELKKVAGTARPLHIRAPRPLSLVQHPVLQQQYPAIIDDASSPASGVFIIPPSPLTSSTFDTGASTPTSASSSSYSTSATSASPTKPMFPDRMEEEGDLSNYGVGVGWSEAHILSGKRSYERIVAPRPQRPPQPLEQVLDVHSPPPTSRTATLAASPPPLSTSPRLPSSPRWTFGSLKNALSNSMSHLVELARSRSPSPLPWLIRGPTNPVTGLTLAGAAAVLDAQNQNQPHVRQGSEEELELERATGCVTPTPAAHATSGTHSRRSSTTTITGPTRHPDSHLPVLKLQVDSACSSDGAMSESPPPKRTLSTSSLSSLGSEPDSESGSSGGIFSRSPSPEPGSERIWDPSYTLTPRSRPISADAKAAVACGGRLSPMMIPGSWDPDELWAEEGDLAKAW